ncbi:hypothetical protein [Dokdonia sinensis]|uniref:hypothetical protein n=1 Tax=Dokdonia sinensis TaxID=2479847 RepID=UPI00191BFFC7|nr:hypothetical protein [Dokdonia sinensis]
MKTLQLLLFVISVSLATSVRAQTVYKTKTGEKYHTETCHYLNRSKAAIALHKAIELGYTACAVCKPNKVTKKTHNNHLSKTSSFTKASTTRTIAVRCSGQNKAGNRCKRKTKSANGRCYQH